MLYYDNFLKMNVQKYDQEIQNELFEQYSKNPTNDLKEKIFLNNIGLVKPIVLRYITQKQNIDDMIQVASIGLWNAIDKFDTTKNILFSTFASSYIKGYLNNEKSIRNNDLSNYMAYSLIKINKYIEQYQVEHNNIKPTDDQIAKALEVKTTFVQMVQNCNVGFVSLDASINNVRDDNKNTNLYDFLEDKQNYFDIEKLVNDDANKSKIKYLFSQLKPKEAKVLTEVAANGLSLEKVGEKYGITKQAISLVYIKAIKHAKEILTDYDKNIKVKKQKEFDNEIKK